MNLDLDPQADALLAEMSEESGLSKSELAEVAVFRIIADWMFEREAKANSTATLDAHDGDHVSG